MVSRTFKTKSFIVDLADIILAELNPVTKELIVHILNGLNERTPLFQPNSSHGEFETLRRCLIPYGVMIVGINTLLSIRNYLCIHTVPETRLLRIVTRFGSRIEYLVPEGMEIEYAMETMSLSVETERLRLNM